MAEQDVNATEQTTQPNRQSFMQLNPKILLAGGFAATATTYWLANCITWIPEGVASIVPVVGKPLSIGLEAADDLAVFAATFYALTRLAHYKHCWPCDEEQGAYTFETYKRAGGKVVTELWQTIPEGARTSVDTFGQFIAQSSLTKYNQFCASYENFKQNKNAPQEASWFQRAKTAGQYALSMVSRTSEPSKQKKLA